MTALLIVLYLTGCALSYGVLFAIFYNLEVEYSDRLPMEHPFSDQPLEAMFAALVTVISWLGFIVGLSVWAVIKYYHRWEMKYFLKFRFTPEKDTKNLNKETE